jgi:diaminopimelate decarboxylase
MRAHEAGALHAEVGHRGPGWLRSPEDVNALLPALWPRTARRDSAGVLSIGGVPVTELAARFGTPVYLLDEADFRARCRDFVESFGDAEIFYAGKAFLCRAVVRMLAEEGLSLDVCTGGELAVALAGGMPPERIGLHGNNKSVDELTRAVDAGVGRIVLDSFQEIDRLTAIARERGVRPRVMIRVTVGVEAHTHEYIATAHEDQKFGFSLAGGAARRAVDRVLGDGVLDLRGLHSHIGSQIFDTDAFEVAAKRVLGLQADIRDAYGVEPAELDLGGGFGIAYTSQDDPRRPAELADALRRIVKEDCDALGVAVPRLSFEPGRAIVGPAVFTLYQVGTVKDVDGIRTYVSVDGGMSDNIRPALYGARYEALLANRADELPSGVYRVAGKHCESGDVLIEAAELPEPRRGDVLAVPATGAYTLALGSTYNGVPRPAVVLVADGEARLIRRRETVEDLLRFEP